MNTNVGRKQKFIKATSDILQKEGREGVNIRRIASEAGCTSAVLYKHFDNLEHLIMLASIQFLEPYMRKMNDMSADKSLNPIQLNLNLWRSFLHEAFSKREYYELMFISGERFKLKSCVEEYYDIFSEEVDNIDPISAHILTSTSIQERELIRLDMAAEQGLITRDNAKMLSQLVEAVFAGRLTQYDESVSPDEAAEECYELIISLYSKYVDGEISIRDN
ncbi:MAG: TetR/AcrR family transcriptional regulator [Bacillota bacterium]|nr:TetR/AcrR family transcriptional regulator [Bacillota bacterium]